MLMNLAYALSSARPGSVEPLFLAVECLRVREGGGA